MEAVDIETLKDQCLDDVRFGGHKAQRTSQCDENMRATIDYLARRGFLHSEPEEKMALHSAIVRLADACDDAIGCVNAAYTEGLAERVGDAPDGEAGSLRDLIERRLVYAATDTTAALIECGEIIGKSRLTLQEGNPSAPDEVARSFQNRVAPWMQVCFGHEISADKTERNHRFLEEAVELVQANGCTQSEAHQLVDYVFNRDQGEINQEAGGVMVTLAALCLASGVDMHEAAETELTRIWANVEKIRAKQAAKPKHSPLPEHSECEVEQKR